VSIETALERVSTIRQAIADPAMLTTSAGATGGTAAPSGEGSSSFAQALSQASTTQTAPSAPYTASALDGLTSAGSSQLGIAYPSQLQGLSGISGYPAAAEGVGGRIVQVAESQIGQTEQPPGSNESPAIAQYRTATAGAIPGAPWCAYFASWAAQQAGAPIGPSGQGLGSVSEIWSWAQSTGRAIPNGPGVVPKPGDLIVFGGEHVGIVRDVLPDGQIQTIEGNYENKVAANVRSPTEATGYVELG